MTPRKSSKARRQRKAWAIRLKDGKLYVEGRMAVFELTREAIRWWTRNVPGCRGARVVRVVVTVEEVGK